MQCLSLHRGAFTRRATRASEPVGPRWASPALLAVLLVACVHSPQAAVPDPRPTEAPAAAGCQETDAARAALSQVQTELRAHGMALEARCPTAASGWVVQVRVVDGIKASKIVRGPLADGQEVDMGTPAGAQVAGAQPGAQGFSPDVQHNREWLRAVMARHAFESAPDAWWRFARRDAAPSGAMPETDLAAR